MKLRTLIALAGLLVCLGMSAQEFKIGDAKYRSLGDGNAELVDYKKAKGEVTLPSTVTDPKSGTSYSLTSIAREAFKKSGATKIVLPESLDYDGIGTAAFKDSKDLTEVVLPESVTVLPNEAFMGCKSLITVNDENIEIIGADVYRNCNLTQWSIPSSVKIIGNGAFEYNPELKIVEVQPNDQILEFGYDVFYGCPIEALVLGRSVHAEKGGIGQNRPFNNNPALRQIIIGPKVDYLSPDFFEGCTNLQVVKLSNPEISAPMAKALGQLGGNAMVYIGDEAIDVPKAIEYNLKSALFKRYAAKYIGATANRDEHGDLYNPWFNYLAGVMRSDYGGYTQLSEQDIKDHLDLFYQMLYEITDNIFAEWTLPFVENESLSINGVANNLIGAIIMENGGSRLSGIRGWADMDLLRKDVAAGDSSRLHDYEVLLGLAELNLKADPKNNVYACALQLAGLCGTGQWEKAAAYYPKAHRLITDNGKYGVPAEVTYMRDVINEHGFKAKDPVYAKAGAKGRKGAKSGGGNSYQKSELLEYFFEKGYQKYKEHRDMRRFKHWLRKTGRI